MTEKRIELDGIIHVTRVEKVYLAKDGSYIREHDARRRLWGRIDETPLPAQITEPLLACPWRPGLPPSEEMIWQNRFYQCHTVRITYRVDPEILQRMRIDLEARSADRMIAQALGTIPSKRRWKPEDTSEGG